MNDTENQPVEAPSEGAGTQTYPQSPWQGTPEGVGEMMNRTIGLLDEHMKPSLVTFTAPDGTEVPAYMTKEGIEVIPPKEFDDYLDKPRFRGGSADLLDLDSFIKHVARFKDSDSVVFADNNREHPSLTAVLDYHHAGASSEPRWGRHRSKHAFPLSDEWNAWNEYNGKPMEMATFSRFLEDRITDVLPTSLVNLTEEQGRFVELRGGYSRIGEPAKLMEVATGLRVYEEVDTVRAYKSETGEATMHFESRQDGGNSGEMKVPSMFALGIPVFRNGDPYQVLVQLRYRPAGGKVLFFYELWREDRVFDHAFNEAVEKVGEDTGLPVLLGKPE